MSRARFRVNSHWIPDCQGIPYSKQIPDSTTKLGYVVKIRSMHVKLWNSELQYITWRLYIYIDISSRNVCNIFIHLMIINIRETWSCELYSFYLFLSYSWINIALFNHWALLIYDILLTIGNHKTLISHHGCSYYLVITGQKEQTIFCMTFRHLPTSDASF